MTYSKALALELLAIEEQSYNLALAGVSDLPDGYSPAIPIRIETENRPILLGLDKMPVWGFMTRKPNERPIVAFRGTQDIPEWGEDSLALPMVDHCGYRVHKGFHEVYSAIRANLAAVTNAYLPVVWIGHSMGAALATLAWLEFGGGLFTFACPRVTDPDGARVLWDGQTVRVINAPDIVPMLPPDNPPLWPFRHGGQEVRVDGPGSFFERKIAHALDSYKIGIEKGS